MIRILGAGAMLAVVLAAFSACTPQSPSSAPPPPTICTGQRPQMCTQEARPVCGTDVRGMSRTYGSPCSACADKTVVSHRLGAC